MRQPPVPCTQPARTLRSPIPVFAALSLFGLSQPLVAQHCSVVPGGPVTHYGDSAVLHPKNANCACTMGCAVGYRCYKGEFGGVEYEVSPPGCDPNAGSCTVKAKIPMVFQGNSQSISGPFRGPRIDVREAGVIKATCGSAGTGDIISDEGTLFVSRSFSCISPPPNVVYEVTATACASASCAQPTTVEEIHFDFDLMSTILCAPRTEYPCQVQACNACAGGSPPGCSEGKCEGFGSSGGPIGGGGHSVVPGGQAGASLRYFAGGVGRIGSPGATAWRASLGRFWSHEFAERIVVDPDEDHVWLLTRDASFIEFSTLAGASGVQPYTAVAPSDEYRKLYHDFGTGEWTLVDLDGDRFFYDSQGRWYRSEDRNGNAWVGTYNVGGKLESVDFPDGQADEFTYDSSGRLRTIVRVGVGGSPTRTWTYEWAGVDLIRIVYPDGKSRFFQYFSDPGYMTHMILVGSTQRVERAWDYDQFGNVTRTWKGALNFTDAAAVDKWELAFDDPEDPTETTVTDPLGDTSVYTFDREPASRKPRILSIDGSCPVCGTAPNTAFTYDAGHPLRVATETSPSGIETAFTFDTFGQLASRTDAANEISHPDLPRITEWDYDTNFPAFVTRIEGPTTVGDPVTRVVTMSYDPTTGDLDDRTMDGVESTFSGGTFSLQTAYTGYNGAGKVGTVDPPGYSTADQTAFTYAVSGTNVMIPDTRVDPLVGTTTYGYDAYNRRTAVTEANGVVTTTVYDALDRVTSVTQGGDPGTGTDDRVTLYTYNTFGDLFCVKSPAGAGTQYLYDAAGRFTEVRRGLAVASPTGSSCLSISSTNFAERQIWTLDGGGHRTNQKLDRGTAAATWVTHSETSWVYDSMCHLDQTIEKIDASNNAITEYAYDCEGRLESVWDPLHPRASFPSQPSTEYDYDSVDRLVAVTQPWGGAGGGTVSTAYAYDVQDHLVEVTDGEGTVTTYEYSDRDLMTGQASEVSGTTVYAYNEHGELEEETDARAVTTVRTIDAADRVTFLDYPTAALDTTYTWGTSAVGWKLGRLTQIAKGGDTVDYTYNPFGEMLTDGDLTYTYDKDGNRLTTLYPPNLLATYAYDRMNRPTYLQLKEGALAAFYVVKNSPLATYKPYGPLTTLRFDLTTDRDETRTFDQRYAPTAITVSGSLFNWNYTNDPVGNVTAISQTLPAAVSRTYGYQDWQYFLNCAGGPWNTAAASCNPATNNPIEWTYDGVGNRLSEARDGASDGYAYETNAATSGNTALLDLVTLGIGGTRDSDHNAGGYLDLVDLGANDIDFTFDDAGSLAEVERPVASESLTMLYDGRGFLREAADAITGGWVKPVYSSEGRLMSLERLPTAAGTAERIHVLYFAGRPAAIWKKVGAAAATWNPIVTDRLGTPVYALTTAGAQHWIGGFEPFGRDHQQGGAQDSLAKGIFLRMPGQWDDSLFNGATLGDDVYFNLYRWYEPQTGRYTRVDPLGRKGDPNPLAYVHSRPTFFVDPLGLVTSKADCDQCCSEQDKQIELNKSGGWLSADWTKYAWSPGLVLGGGSCLTSASQLHDDLERQAQPRCWVTNVQLTKSFGADAVKAACGTYFPVHYVVKYTPCDGKGDDYFFDGYLGPDWGPLPQDVQIDEP